MRRRRRTEFSAKAAKNKWDTLQKNVNAVVNKRQTVANIEKDMDVWLKVCTLLQVKYHLQQFIGWTDINNFSFCLKQPHQRK